MSMSRSKRFQIPVNSAEEELFKSASRRAGLSAAEWARQHLKVIAMENQRPETPREALTRLFSLNAPVAEVKEMKAQSLKGRYK